MAQGQNSVATGDQTSAFGAGANATFANSTAIGAGAVTTAPNQMVFGTPSNTYVAPASPQMRALQRSRGQSTS